MAVDLTNLTSALIDQTASIAEEAARSMLGSLPGLVWDWNSGGGRAAFPPHLALNGSYGASEGSFDGYFVGDHIGCLCAYVPVSEVSEIVSVSGGSTTVVSVVFAEYLMEDASSDSSFSFGGYEVSISAPGGSPTGWDNLFLEFEQRWPEAVQAALDSTVIG